MGRRRGSADNNTFSIDGVVDGNFRRSRVELFLFTTDSSGNLIQDSARNDENLGLFEQAIQDFSFYLSETEPRVALFERSDGEKLFFESDGDLQASLNGNLLTYEIQVDSGKEQLRFAWDYKISALQKLEADGLVNIDFSLDNIQAQLVNSLSLFSEVVGNEIVNSLAGDAGGGSIIPNKDTVLPSFVGDSDLDSSTYPNIFSGDFERLKNGQAVTFGLDLEAEEDINLPATEPLPTPFGTSSSEILIGTPEADDIFGNGGEDIIEGLEGNDKLYGGNQADDIDGGDDDDVLFGNEGANRLVGGSGDDELYGGNQSDTILGGAGDDTIYDNSGDDFIDSGSGFDLIRLGGGKDIVILSTGEGYDTIENYQLGMTILQGFAQSELDFVAKNGDTEIFKGSDKLAVIRWKTPEQLSSGLFAV